MAVIWTRVALRALTDNRPGLEALRVGVEESEEKFAKLERLTQSREPEWKAQLSSDVKWARQRLDDIVADTNELELQFQSLKAKTYRAWEEPGYLDELRGGGRELIGNLTEMGHLAEELMMRTGKTRDDLAHTKSNLSAHEG